MLKLPFIEVVSSSASAEIAMRIKLFLWKHLMIVTRRKLKSEYKPLCFWWGLCMRTRSPVVAATKHGCSPSNSPIEIRPGSSFWLRFSVKIGMNILSPIELTFFSKSLGFRWGVRLQRNGESQFTWAVYESPLKLQSTFLGFISRCWKNKEQLLETFASIKKNIWQIIVIYYCRNFKL